MGIFDTVTQGYVIIDKKKRTFKLTNARKHVYDKKGGLLRGAANLYTLGLLNAVSNTKSVTKAFSFSDLIGAELLEDNSMVTSCSVGSALMLGVLGKKNTRKVINNLAIKVTVNDLDCPDYIIVLISKKTKTKSKKYKQAMEIAQKSLSALNVILNQQQKIEALEDDPADFDETNFSDDEEMEDEKETNAEVNPYEEIKKLKELLDMGILSQEEFDKKKKELLNL
ncbi:SHOCT domain-containing protein [Holdemania filiformis]|uniref:SHOCT domain-containing protein n=1 Tax=Holdemania filiformis TaxID=61171 RepID=UPI0026760974|nr:SHOCT domain-containing protein [Holdemania filiformis]